METLLEKQERAMRSMREGKCTCHKCLSDRDEMRVMMIVCPTCGNKRCPKASDHRLECTNSNAAGQAGSVYR
jgi:Zn finger protein HypA/HybF involved in hydrogenase expression